MAKKFHDFYQTCPENERVNLAEFVPSVEGVIDQVKRVHLKYEAKRKDGITGRTKRFFYSFCGTINAHKSLLGILPEGNEYISIFTGVLHVVIQVFPVFKRNISLYVEMTLKYGFRLAITTRSWLRGSARAFPLSENALKIYKSISNYSQQNRLFSWYQNSMDRYSFSCPKSWTGSWRKSARGS